MNTFSPLIWLYFGKWLESRNLSALAESCYRNAAAGGGKRASESAFLLAKRLLDQDQNQEAQSVCEQALLKAPYHSRLWCSLGAARRRLAQMPAARAAYEKAIEYDAGYSQAWSNLGEWQFASGQPAAALESLDRALSLDQTLIEAMNNRIAVLYELGRYQEAEATARGAIESHPQVAALHVNLGNVLMHTGKARQAVKSFRKALECDPAFPEAHINLATMLGETHRLAEAQQFIEHEIAIKGESAQRLASLAMAQRAKGDQAAAEATCRKVIEMQPGNIAALVTLAGCLSTRADHAGANQLLEQALVTNPNMPAIYSNIAFNATYLPNLTVEQVFDCHREWARRYEPQAYKRPYKFEYSQDKDRPLRIGYVSGDFGRHPVGFLLRDIALHHDRSQFSIHCYSMMRHDDEITVAIRNNADSWVDALLMGDEELADKIHEDKIDILVDLAGHTAYNRLPSFALKPAPIQATWIGYFHSTGMESIDYFITDPVTSPKGCGQLFSEIPVWLPHSRFCYSPPDYAPEVALPPMMECGTVTFGSFNRMEKLVDPVVAAWVAVVNGVPGSRLLIKAGNLDNEVVQQNLRERFVAQGLASDRLELRGPSAHHEMLEEYGDIDIALDPFPFNGGMTTLEALWMGVPVVTIAGKAVVSRQTVSVLENIGCPELAYPDVDGYIQGAIALAKDAQRLTALRRELRHRMANSPIRQPEMFARDLETLYRSMWQAWCRDEMLESQILTAPPVTRKLLLHVGCGQLDIRFLPSYFQRGWKEIRFDIDPEAAPDIVGNMLDMKDVADKSVDAVFSSHNIEHLYPHEVGIALKEFLRVLKPEGMLVLTCPDLQSVAKLVADDKLDDTAYMAPAGPIAPHDMLYGYRQELTKGNYYMAHRTGFTLTTLLVAVKGAGFACVSGIRKEASFELWVIATSSPVSNEELDKLKTAVLPE